MPADMMKPIYGTVSFRDSRTGEWTQIGYTDPASLHISFGKEEELTEIERLKKENAQLEQENALLKRANDNWWRKFDKIINDGVEETLTIQNLEGTVKSLESDVQYLEGLVRDYRDKVKTLAGHGSTYLNQATSAHDKHSRLRGSLLALAVQYEMGLYTATTRGGKRIGKKIREAIK